MKTSTGIRMHAGRNHRRQGNGCSLSSLFLLRTEMGVNLRSCLSKRVHRDTKSDKRKEKRLLLKRPLLLPMSLLTLILAVCEGVGQMTDAFVTLLHSALSPHSPLPS